MTASLRVCRAVASSALRTANSATFACTMFKDESYLAWATRKRASNCCSSSVVITPLPFSDLRRVTLKRASSKRAFSCNTSAALVGSSVSSASLGASPNAARRLADLCFGLLHAQIELLRLEHGNRLVLFDCSSQIDRDLLDSAGHFGPQQGLLVFGQAALCAHHARPRLQRRFDHGQDLVFDGASILGGAERSLVASASRHDKYAPRPRKPTRSLSSAYRVASFEMWSGPFCRKSKESIGRTASRRVLISF